MSSWDIDDSIDVDDGGPKLRCCAVAAFRGGRIVVARTARADARGNRPRWNTGTTDDGGRAGFEQGRASAM